MIGSAAGILNGKVSMHGNIYKNGLLFLISSIFISFSLVLLLWNVSENAAGGVLKFIGRNTLVITAVHCPMLRFLEQFSPETKLFVKTYPNITAVLILAASMIIAWIIRRFFPFIIGEKRKKTEKKLV